MFVVETHTFAQRKRPKFPYEMTSWIQNGPLPNQLVFVWCSVPSVPSHTINTIGMRILCAGTTKIHSGILTATAKECPNQKSNLEFDLCRLADVNAAVKKDSTTGNRFCIHITYTRVRISKTEFNSNTPTALFSLVHLISVRNRFAPRSTADVSWARRRNRNWFQFRWRKFMWTSAHHHNNVWIVLDVQLLNIEFHNFAFMRHTNFVFVGTTQYAFRS